MNTITIPVRFTPDEWAYLRRSVNADAEWIRSTALSQAEIMCLSSFRITHPLPSLGSREKTKKPAKKGRRVKGGQAKTQRC